MNSSRATTASSIICSPPCRARRTSLAARIGTPRAIISARFAKSPTRPSTRCGGTCLCISLSIEDSNVLSARRCSTGPEISALTCKRFIKCDLKSSSSKTTSSPSQKRSFWKLPPPEINKLIHPKYSMPDHQRNILKETIHGWQLLLELNLSPPPARHLDTTVGSDHVHGGTQIPG